MLFVKQPPRLLCIFSFPFAATQFCSECLYSRGFACLLLNVGGDHLLFVFLTKASGNKGIANKRRVGDGVGGHQSFFQEEIQFARYQEL